MGFPSGSVVKNPPAMQETQIRSLGRENPLEKGLPSLVLLPGESHGQRSLVGYSPWGRKESDTTERLSRHAHPWRTEVLLPPQLSAGSFQGPLVSLPRGLPSSNPSIETLTPILSLALNLFWLEGPVLPQGSPEKARPAQDLEIWMQNPPTSFFRRRRPVFRVCPGCDTRSRLTMWHVPYRGCNAMLLVLVLW